MHFKRFHLLKIFFFFQAAKEDGLGNEEEAKGLTEEIKKHIPNFEITYKPDFRQAIADSWPMSIDDSVARKDWGLQCKYDLKKMTEVMINEIKKKIQK